MSDGLSITSDKDYLKIVTDDFTIVTADDSSPDADSQFPADPDAPLGFAGSHTIDLTEYALSSVPLVRAFWDPYHTDTWYNARVGIPSALTDPWLKFIATQTSLKLIMNTNDFVDPAYYIPVFYRIYDVGDYSLTSDKRIDKIFKKDTAVDGTVDSTPDSFVPETLVLTAPHDLGEACIFSLEFSEDQDDWYPEGAQITGPPDTSSGPPGGPYSSYYYTRAAMYADSENAYIYLESNYSTTKTIYVRYSLDKMQ